MKIKYAVITAVTVMAGAWTASASLTVNSGDISIVSPGATSYGALRFKDFSNARDGYGGIGNVYLQDKAGALGAATGVDGRSRVQSTDGNGWVDGLNQFSFEYRPVIGATDLILAQAADSTTIQRTINDPAKPVNFISFYILNRTTESGDITLNLTDLSGNSLTASALTVSSVNQANWYLSDPTLLANGFILSGSINLVNPRDASETDKIDIAFGNAAVPEPTTMIAGALLLLPFGASTLRMLRKKA